MIATSDNNITVVHSIPTSEVGQLKSLNHRHAVITDMASLAPE
jgi:hypothetical protein